MIMPQATLPALARFPVALALLAALSLSACTTTSGSQRLDETGERLNSLAVEQDEALQPVKPASPSRLIAALNGGVIGRAAGLTLNPADRNRALEAEYKALELAPAGQGVVWTGSQASGEVTAAVPYQVGRQNCRQLSHTVNGPGGRAFVARGAACRNPDGSWSPLT